MLSKEYIDELHAKHESLEKEYQDFWKKATATHCISKEDWQKIDQYQNDLVDIEFEEFFNDQILEEDKLFKHGIDLYHHQKGICDGGLIGLIKTKNNNSTLYVAIHQDSFCTDWPIQQFTYNLTKHGHRKFHIFYKNKILHCLIEE